MKPEFRGVDESQALDRQSLVRDTRTPFKKAYDTICAGRASAILLLMLAVISVVFPQSCLVELMFGLAIYVMTIRRSKKDRLPFRLPQSWGGPDPSDPTPGRKGVNKAQGTFYFGNEFKSDGQLWFKPGDILTHFLIFGTTGSGKTETLVSLASNYLAQGSGFAYVDPKAAPKLAVQIWTLARIHGRDDDFRVLNYLTGGTTIRGKQPRRMSNTTNPLAYCSADTLTQTLVALIPASTDGNAIFSQNAQTVLSGLSYALCELRDRNELEISIETVREHLTLAMMIKLAKRKDLSRDTIGAISSALRTVGWNPELSDNQQPKSLPEQFGYARAYFGLALASLSDTYGHIYRNASSEIEMRDVILQRRVFVAMIPSLEKAPQELQNIGKIILSSLRNATAVGLGDKIEGTVEDVLNSLPTDAKTPFGMIIDEYAAITTPGFAEVLTQGRGLGISTIISSQDWGGIEKADEKGAGQIAANTKVKVCMTLEDAQGTWEFFKRQAGEALTARARSFNADGSSYIPETSADIAQVDRIDIVDLQKQIEGECHIFLKGDIVRGFTFYANPPLERKQQLRIARMLRVDAPDKKKLDLKFGHIKDIKEQLLHAIDEGPSDVDVPQDVVDYIKPLQEALNHPTDLSAPDMAIYAFKAWQKSHEQGVDDFFAGWNGCADHSDKTKTEAPKATEAPEQVSKDSCVPSVSAEEELQEKMGEDSLLADLGLSDVEPEQTASPERSNVQAHATWISNQMEGAEDEVGVGGLVVNTKMKEDIVGVEQAFGAEEAAAQSMVAALSDEIENSLEYPVPPTPRSAECEDVRDRVANAVDSILARVAEKTAER